MFVNGSTAIRFLSRFADLENAGGTKLFTRAESADCKDASLESDVRGYRAFPPLRTYSEAGASRVYAILMRAGLRSCDDLNAPSRAWACQALTASSRLAVEISSHAAEENP